MDSPLPFPIEQYKLEKNLGFGGQGIVSLYVRKDNRLLYLPEMIAVKCIPVSKLEWSREMEIMFTLAINHHPNLVRCYGSCEIQEGETGIVMDVYDCDLQKYLTKKGMPCTVSEAKHILQQLARALKHLWELKIVHRDIKPANILIKKDENDEITVTLTDLGVSKHMTRTQQCKQTNVGTDIWIAPEIRDLDDPVTSTYGHPADVYGFGMTAIFLLTKKFPRKRFDSADKLAQWVDMNLKDVDISDEKFRTLIVGCLEFEPARRIRKEKLINPDFYGDEEMIILRKQLSEEREAVLKALCGILAFLILVTITKLLYDYWNYRKRGKLPWIVYRMP